MIVAVICADGARGNAGRDHSTKHYIYAVQSK